MQILMVDDHTMFLQGLKTLLGVLMPDLRCRQPRKLVDAFATLTR